MRNFWSCEVAGTDLEPVAGQSQSLEFGDVPAGTRIYASIVTLSSDSNMSEPSNVAFVDMP